MFVGGVHRLIDEAYTTLVKWREIQRPHRSISISYCKFRYSEIITRTIVTQDW